ncbi:MAG: hypothetical protein HY703_04000 [Gemmatimonadetes bacterium]|nr:hypothetical protein [Gemmatimonadota bacterium]
MAKLRSITSLVLLALLLGGAVTPLAADGVADCYERVIAKCTEALERSKWWEKPAVGIVCAGMLIGCTPQGLSR